MHSAKITKIFLNQKSKTHSDTLELNMRKVAICWLSDDCYDEYGDMTSVVNTVSEWTEINDTDYQVLVQASYIKRFRILEQPIDQPAFIAKTIQDYILEQKVVLEKEAEDKKKRAAAALKKKLQKDLKDKESKRELFEKLKKELDQ